jgi:hypothetical protein
MLIAVHSLEQVEITAVRDGGEKVPLDEFGSLRDTGKPKDPQRIFRWR